MTARRYETPRAFKQALEDRVKRRAQETAEDIGRLRQRSVFERFLARLVTHLGDRVVLKGGIALRLRVENARTTYDLDFRMSGDPSSLLQALKHAGQLALDGDFLTFTVEPDPRHPAIEDEGLVCEGKRFRVEAALAGKIYGARSGVDVGFGDSMARPPEILSAGGLFDFAGIPPVSVYVYAREVHVAEKLHALTLSRARENTRVKDLPDHSLAGDHRPLRERRARGRHPGDVRTAGVACGPGGNRGAAGELGGALREHGGGERAALDDARRPHRSRPGVPRSRPPRGRRRVGSGELVLAQRRGRLRADRDYGSAARGPQRSGTGWNSR